MVGIKGEGSAFEHWAEVPDGFKRCQQFSVIWDPILLLFGQLCAIERQWFPTLRSPLLQYAADSEFRCVRGEG